jgi:hypothetical protein
MNFLILVVIHGPYKRKIFLYDKGDFDSYRQQLTDVDWETLFGHNDVDTIVDIITNTILNIADNTIPNRFITVHKDSRPWITTSIKKFIRRKNRIHKKAKHHICKLLSIRVKITLVVKKYFPFIRCRWFTRMV